MQIRLSKDLTSLELVHSNITYSLSKTKFKEGSYAPKMLGAGKFAKVFEATQKCHNQKLTTVAIKSLHARADCTAELLFDMEIKILADLANDNTSCYVKALDLLHLGPLFMSSCGKLYHPECPKGCGTKLVRSREIDKKNFPSLACPNKTCKYSVSAEYIDGSQGELFQHPANPHAPRKEEMTPGTIINFVDRRVIVMEKLGQSLDDFFDASARKAAERLQKTITWDGNPKEYAALRQKILLLHKMDLMIQLTEAVERLHSTHKLIHRDLAPDNIMIQAIEHDGSNELFVAQEQDLYNTRCPWRVKLIDFGLSEEGESLDMLPWYTRGDVNTQANKWPYMSPEAQQREEDLRAFSNESFSNESLVLPEVLCGSDLAPQRGDMIADKNLRDPDCEYKIVDIKTNERGQTIAVLDRTPPSQLSGRALHLIRRLGRAHDVYSIGAIFYYILTGAHKKTRQLSAFTVNFQENPLPFAPKDLNTHPNYPLLRDSIPITTKWADELMILILRSMIRGHDGSFVTSRTALKSDGVRQFRQELKRLYHLIQREVIAWPLAKDFSRQLREHDSKLREETSELRRHSQTETTVLKNYALAMSLLCSFSILLLLFAYYSFT